MICRRIRLSIRYARLPLTPRGGNVPYVIKGISETAVNGQELGLGGYLDIGLIDTMQDLIVNFIGAVIFSVIGFFYVKTRGRGNVAGEIHSPQEDSGQGFPENRKGECVCRGQIIFG